MLQDGSVKLVYVLISSITIYQDTKKVES